MILHFHYNALGFSNPWIRKVSKSKLLFISTLKKSLQMRSRHYMSESGSVHHAII